MMRREPTAMSRALYEQMRPMMDDVVAKARRLLEDGHDPDAVSRSLFNHLCDASRALRLPDYVGYGVGAVAMVELARRDIMWEASIKEGHL